ncbi:MAG: DUF4139 domain-containing protein [Bacteroidia bacterium]
METYRYKKLRIGKYELRIIFLCVFASLRLTLFAQSEQKVSSSISSVTVFINQAQVTRLAKVSLDAGVSTLVFDKISPLMNPNSIQVKVDGNLTLLSVSTRQDYLKEDEKPKQVILLEDSLQSLKWALESLNNKRQTCQFERDVMKDNKKIGGQQNGVKPDDLDDALTLFKKRMNEVNEEMQKLNLQEKKLNAIKQKIENQINEYQSGSNINAPEILVTVKTLSSVNNSKIELSYLVNNASWLPFYDIRVTDTKSPLQLVSKAFITQNTKEDWKNVTIKLSTSNPNEGGTKPELQTNYLRYYQPRPIGTYAPRKKMNSAAPSMQDMEMKSMNQSIQSEEKPVEYSQGIATETQTPVNIEFNVTSAYSIPSDNHPHQVDLTVVKLDAVYAYGAVPKLDKDAFITAKVSGNDLVNQVSGEANVYVEGTFIGKTFINGTTNDSVLLSLGRDKRIQIQRVKLKDFSSTGIVGSNKKELNTWEIKIRNTRKEPIMVIVEDQIPVSTDKEIEVKLVDGGKAKYEEATGKLTWMIMMEAEQSQSLKFSFEVKHPKEKQITGY